jgi:hypothetical protein
VAVALWVFMVLGIRLKRPMARPVLVLAARPMRAVVVVLLAPLLRAYRVLALKCKSLLVAYFQTRLLFLLADCFAQREAVALVLR